MMALVTIPVEAFVKRTHEEVEPKQSISLHEWTVFANVWTRTKGLKGYAHVDALRVLCVTLHAPDGRPQRTRWRIVGESSFDSNASSSNGMKPPGGRTRQRS
jgi:hypothetical protein